MALRLPRLVGGFLEYINARLGTTGAG